MNIKGVINNVAAGDTFTVDDATYTVLSFNDDSITAAVEGTPADNLGTSIAINSTKTINGIDGADITSEQLFKLSGISTPTGITINEKVVTVSNDNLDGSTVSIEGEGYTLALANTVPEPASISTDTITITSTNNTISADGVYQFASDFTGTGHHRRGSNQCQTHRRGLSSGGGLHRRERHFQSQPLDSRPRHQVVEHAL